jgi:hypothetical protein
MEPTGTSHSAHFKTVSLVWLAFCDFDCRGPSPSLTFVVDTHAVRRSLEQLARSDRSKGIRARVWVLAFGLVLASALLIAISELRTDRPGDEVRRKPLLEGSLSVSVRAKAKQQPEEAGGLEIIDIAADDERAEDGAVEQIIQDRSTWIDGRHLSFEVVK